jgi:acylphosphatase
MAKRLLISGRVQGVGFRDSMSRQAEGLGALGWVRNRHDGRVEAVIDGEAEAIEALLRWAHRGPRAERDDAVEVEEAYGGFTRFERRASV